ncbi:MAG: band 7 protein [Chthonomonadaceae bacterium]|nr:band 7 protein [Chthonomonadaceae bacterium]
MKTNRRTVAMLLLAALAISLTAGCGYKTIPPGSVGVKFNGSTGVSQHLLKPELVWVGYNETLVIYPTNIQQVSYVRDAKEGDKPKDDSIRATTSEGAPLPVDVTVSYRIPNDGAALTAIFNRFGMPDEDPEHPLTYIQNEFVRWATVVAVNKVSGRHSIFDLLSKDRASFGPEVKAELQPIMEEWGLHLEDVLIREIHPPDSITAKITEQQGARAELAQLKIQKQQAVLDAKTTIINAQREAEKNRLLSLQGDQAVALKKLELRRVFIERWDGQSGLVGDGPIPQF